MQYVSGILIHNSFTTKNLFAISFSLISLTRQIKQVTSHYRAHHSDKDLFILTLIIKTTVFTT